jgi:hypothetical protein
MSEIDQLAKEIRRRPAENRAVGLMKLLDLADSSASQSEVLVAVLDLCTDGTLQGIDLDPHAATFLRLWKDIFDRARSMQGPPEKQEWKIDDDYSEVRRAAGILLDLIGYLPIQQVENALREGLSLTDPRLKMFAALSFLRQLHPVEPDELERIGASHEVRILLWEQLKSMKMEWLMPEIWSSPEQLAASELSRWIGHPMELGTPPEEIEHMETFHVRTDSGIADVYLFRFREFPKPCEPGEGWMARTPAEHFTRLYNTVSGCN